MIDDQKDFDAYLFGPILFTGNTSAYAMFKTRDPLKVEAIISGQQGLEVALRVRQFLCSVCKQDYETCPHYAYHNDKGVQCVPLMHKLEVMHLGIVPKPTSPRTRITDMLLVMNDGGNKQYVWYGYPIELESRRVAHIKKAFSRNLITNKARDHFINIFHLSLNGIGTYPPNPFFILKQGYRLDWIQDIEMLSDKEVEQFGKGKKDGLYMKMGFQFDPERYENKIVDGIEYLYDKFDKILIPHNETVDFFIKNIAGSNLYWIRPKVDDIKSYVKGRIPEIEKSFEGMDNSPYRFADESEDFLSKLERNYVTKFVILNIDIKGSTSMSFKLSLGDNALIAEIFSREMTNVVDNYRGYVLKHMGDGILAYFPIPAFWGMDDNALDCAVTMKFIIEEGINTIFLKRNLPMLKFRIGMDSGDAVVTNMGDVPAKQHKDLIGKTINLVTKIQSATEENQIVIGNTMVRNLGVHRRKLFREFKPTNWNISLSNMEGIYPIHKLAI